HAAVYQSGSGLEQAEGRRMNPQHASGWRKNCLILFALAFLMIFLLLPLVTVFAEALSRGFGAYGAALVEPDALAAIRLTLLVAAISVPLNIAFGIVAAWAIAKFDFPGKSLLITFIDLPF